MEEDNVAYRRHAVNSEVLLQTYVKPSLVNIFRYFSLSLLFIICPFYTEFINFYGKTDYSSWRCPGSSCLNLSTYNRSYLCSKLLNSHTITWTSNISVLAKWDKICDDETLLHQDLQFAGSITGGIICGLGIHRFGRKVWVLVFGTLGAVVMILVSISTSYTVFLVYKYFETAILVLYFVSGFLLLMESLPRSRRPLIFISYTVSATLGRIIISLSVVYLKDWRIVHIVFLVILVITVMTLTLVPESLPYLVSRGSKHRLHEALTTLSSNWRLHNTIHRINEPQEPNGKVRWIIGNCLLFCRFVVISFIFAVAGVFNAYYSRSVDSKAYLEKFNIYIGVVGLGVLLLPIVVKRYRCILIALFLIMSGLFVMNNFYTSPFLYTIIVGTAQTTTLLLLYVAAEVFPVVYRGVVLGVGISFNSIGCLLNSYFVDVDETGDSTLKIILAFVGIVCGCFIYALPQSKTPHSPYTYPFFPCDITHNFIQKPVVIESKCAKRNSKYNLSADIFDKIDDMSLKIVPKYDVYVNYRDHSNNENNITDFANSDETTIRIENTASNSQEISPMNPIANSKEVEFAVDIHRNFSPGIPPTLPDLSQRRFARYMSMEGTCTVTPEEVIPQDVIKDRWKARMCQMQELYQGEVLEYMSSSESSQSTKSMEIGDITFKEEDVSVHSDESSPIHFLPLTLLFSQDLHLVE